MEFYYIQYTDQERFHLDLCLSASHFVWSFLLHGRSLDINYSDTEVMKHLDPRSEHDLLRANKNFSEFAVSNSFRDVEVSHSPAEQVCRLTSLRPAWRGTASVFCLEE